MNSFMLKTLLSCPFVWVFYFFSTGEEERMHALSEVLTKKLELLECVEFVL